MIAATVCGTAASRIHSSSSTSRPASWSVSGELHAAAGSVGYWIAAGARNRGIATRAVRLVCEWWPERPLHLTTHPDNIASQRVAEQAGFRRVGTTPHEPRFRDGTTEAVLFELV